MIPVNFVEPVYHPQGLDIWHYLDRIPSAIEAASAVVLPTAVIRAYMPKDPDADRRPANEQAL